MNETKPIGSKFVPATFACSVYMIILTVFFDRLGFKVLETMNAVWALAFFAIGCSIRRESHLSNFFKVTEILLLVYSVVHMLLLSQECGYIFIILGYAPALFSIKYKDNKDGKPDIKNPIINCTCMVLIFYIAWGVRLSQNTDIYKINDFWQNTLFIINSIIAYLMIIGFFALFITRNYSARAAMARANTTLEDAANIDPLTKLYNRRMVDSMLEKYHLEARGMGEDFSILMCDIDNFKRVNDTYGHDCGDLVLANIASKLKEAVRSQDMVFRWGGEEMLIIIKDGRYVSEKVAERCRQLVEDSKVDFKGTEVSVTITIGGASYYQGSTTDILIERADKNLYTGKTTGKNKVVF